MKKKEITLLNDDFVEKNLMCGIFKDIEKKIMNFNIIDKKKLSFMNERIKKTCIYSNMYK